MRRKGRIRPFRRILLRSCQGMAARPSIPCQGRKARMISQRDVEQYRQTGYLVVPDVLDGALLARMRGALDQLVADASAVREHTDVYDLEPGHRPDNPKVRRIKLPHAHTPVFWELAQYRPLVAILEKLLGPSGVRLHGSKINLKEPHHGSPVEWHQDWAFYPHTNDDLLAVGVMLDDEIGRASW